MSSVLVSFWGWFFLQGGCPLCCHSECPSHLNSPCEKKMWSQIGLKDARMGFEAIHYFWKYPTFFCIQYAYYVWCSLSSNLYLGLHSTVFWGHFGLEGQSSEILTSCSRGGSTLARSSQLAQLHSFFSSYEIFGSSPGCFFLVKNDLGWDSWENGKKDLLVRRRYTCLGLVALLLLRVCYPVYRRTCPFFPLPASIARKLGCLQRDFLWDGPRGEPKFHLANWKTICSLVSRGGLGVKNLMLFNKSLMGKWLWRLMQEENSLWR